MSIFICVKCKVAQDDSCFAYRSSGVSKGYDTTCRMCRNEHNRKRHAVRNEKFKSLEGEYWKQIPIYEDYEASNLGRIRSLYIINGHGKYLRNRPCLLKMRENKKTGYWQTFLGRKGINRRNMLIHRVIAITFIENKFNKPFVNHKNGNKANNFVLNLEWATKSENEIHAHQTGLKDFKGEKAGYRKVSYFIADKIREEYKNGGITQKELGKKYLVTQATIGGIVNNIRWIKN